MNKQRYAINMIKRFFWSSLSLPAYEQVGQGQHSLAAHFAKRNTKNCGGEKRSGGSEGGQKFLPRRVAKRLLRGVPPSPFLFARPSGKILIKIQNLDFRQKRFGLCRIIAQKKKALKPSFFVVVRPAGIEPATSRLRGGYSTG